MPNDQDPESPNPEPKYVTADEIGNIVNSALTARFPKMLAPALDAALKPILDKLSAPAPAPASDDDDGKKKSKQNPEMLAMAKQIEDLTNGIKQRDERVAAAEKKGREDKAFADMRASLEGKVRPELLGMLAENLFHVQKRVEFDEQGTPLFKTTRIPYIGAEPEEQRLPLSSGIEDFLKSESAKPFLPAPSSGSGAPPLPKRGSLPTSTGTDFSKPATTDAEKTRRAMEREQRAQDRLGKR